MKQHLRQAGAWSDDGEAAYSTVEWDDVSGDADIAEFDSKNQVIKRFEWRRDDNEVLLVEFGPEGDERSRKRISHGVTRGW